MARNLAPKFSTFSKITPAVREILHEIHQTPVKIPNVMAMDNPIVNIKKQTSAYNNKRHIAEYQHVDQVSLTRYFNNYEKGKEVWRKYTSDQRGDIFLHAADLIENKYRDRMLAYTIAGQNKSIYEAEIDAICELCDFLRFNVDYYNQILDKQPRQGNNNDIVNVSQYNALPGFTAAITPFNFTAIGGNLASAPLLFGNSVLWKPSDNAVLSNYLFYEIMLEAGLPRGILNFCPMSPNSFFKEVNKSNDLSAVLFTGSSMVFNDIYYQIGKNVVERNNYTRLIGETGGKNFHFADDTFSRPEDLKFLAEETVNSAFGYSGQKCSACSILYIPEENLQPFITFLKNETARFIYNSENYGVVNYKSYTRIEDILNNLKSDPDISFVNHKADEDCSNNKDEMYYISPNILICRDHNHRVFSEEFFAPILTIYPYSKESLDETLELCKNTNNYALTGSIFSKDYNKVNRISDFLMEKTGNFYVNCRSTGSVVGNQPFGGSGKSGTNDKAGDVNLLYRLFNQRNLKINYGI